jgi:hypothetical protein
MAQVTLRMTEELAGEVKRAAHIAGKSVNAWTTAILSAAVDPDLADSELQAVRERLARAGLLEPPKETGVRRPSPARLQRARTAAGRGTPLSRIVSEGRR